MRQLLEAGGQLDLALKPLRPQAGGELGAKDLQRERPLVLEIAVELTEELSWLPGSATLIS